MACDINFALGKNYESFQLKWLHSNWIRDNKESCDKLPTKRLCVWMWENFWVAECCKDIELLYGNTQYHLQYKEYPSIHSSSPGLTILVLVWYGRNFFWFFMKRQADRCIHFCIRFDSCITKSSSLQLLLSPQKFSDYHAQCEGTVSLSKLRRYIAQHTLVIYLVDF